jgi:hypothetical protein
MVAVNDPGHDHGGVFTQNSRQTVLAKRGATATAWRRGQAAGRRNRSASSCRDGALQLPLEPIDVDWLRVSIEYAELTGTARQIGCR